MPKCPLCNKRVMVTVNQRPDQIMDQHIRQGCKTHLVEEERARARAIRSAKFCEAPSCSNPNNYDTVNCKTCRKQFCLTHRGGAHTCIKPAAPEVKTKNGAASRLLAKLRGGKEGEDPRRKRAKAKVESTRRAGRNKPVGDPRLMDADRFYLEVLYSSSPYAPQAQPSATISMWFNKSHTVGRVLDSVCRQTNIENRNNQPNQSKLHLVHNRTGAQLPYDIPLHLLSPELNQGDTVKLIVIPAN